MMMFFIVGSILWLFGVCVGFLCGFILAVWAKVD